MLHIINFILYFKTKLKLQIRSVSWKRKELTPSMPFIWNVLFVVPSTGEVLVKCLTLFFIGVAAGAAIGATYLFGSSKSSDDKSKNLKKLEENKDVKNINELNSDINKDNKSSSINSQVNVSDVNVNKSDIVEVVDSSYSQDIIFLLKCGAIGGGSILLLYGIYLYVLPYFSFTDDNNKRDSFNNLPKNQTDINNFINDSLKDLNDSSSRTREDDEDTVIGGSNINPNSHIIIKKPDASQLKFYYEHCQFEGESIALEEHIDKVRNIKTSYMSDHEIHVLDIKTQKTTYYTYEEYYTTPGIHYEYFYDDDGNIRQPPQPDSQEIENENNIYLNFGEEEPMTPPPPPIRNDANVSSENSFLNYLLVIFFEFFTFFIDFLVKLITK